RFALRHGVAEFSVYQGKWDDAIRGFERDIVPMCNGLGVALAPRRAVGRVWRSRSSRSSSVFTSTRSTWLLVPDEWHSHLLAEDASVQLLSSLSVRKKRNIKIWANWARMQEERAADAAREKMGEDEFGCASIARMELEHGMKKRPNFFPFAFVSRIRQLEVNSKP
ncbi:hypothetical protein K437DRAFT_221449, partial [Tilletiaria anomala UBC 951]